MLQQKMEGMTVILMPEMAEFVKQNIVLKHRGKSYDIEIQIYIPFG